MNTPRLRAKREATLKEKKENFQKFESPLKRGGIPHRDVLLPLLLAFFDYLLTFDSRFRCSLFPKLMNKMQEPIELGGGMKIMYYVPQFERPEADDPAFHQYDSSYVLSSRYFTRQSRPNLIHLSSAHHHHHHHLLPLTATGKRGRWCRSMGLFTVTRPCPRQPRAVPPLTMLWMRRK